MFFQYEHTEGAAAACIAAHCIAQLAAICASTPTTSFSDSSSPTHSATPIPAIPLPGSVKESSEHSSAGMLCTTSITQNAASCSPDHPAEEQPLEPITEMLLRQANTPRGHDRRPRPPEGVCVCTFMQHFACTCSTLKCYSLDRISPAAHAALEELPVPVRNLTGAALQLVMCALPLHACALLSPAIRFLSFEAHVMHARTQFGAKHRSLNLSHVTLPSHHLACMLNYIPLLPPLHSLAISKSQILSHPFPKRKQKLDLNPHGAEVRTTVALWITLRAALRALSRSLTHLSLAHSTVDRSALLDMASILRGLKCLDITELTVSAAPRLEFMTITSCTRTSRWPSPSCHIAFTA